MDNDADDCAGHDAPNEASTAASIDAYSTKTTVPINIAVVAAKTNKEDHQDDIYAIIDAITVMTPAILINLNAHSVVLIQAISRHYKYLNIQSLDSPQDDSQPGQNTPSDPDNLYPNCKCTPFFGAL